MDQPGKQIKTLIFSIALSLVAISHASLENEKKTVLITTFAPWAGRPINLTERIAKELKENEVGLLGDEIQIEICTLPVEYERSITLAKECFKRLEQKPNLVISLGEGGSGVAVELVGTNVTGYDEDEAGRKKEGIIDPKGPDHVFSTLPAHLFTSTELQVKDAQFLSFSKDAGEFVCNYNAYTMGKYFAKKHIPYGFVHMPAYRWTNQDDRAILLAGHTLPKITESARVLANIIKTSLNFYKTGSLKKKLKEAAAASCKTFHQEER